MKYYLRLLRIYFKNLSIVSPRLASRQAFRLFQKVRTGPLSHNEKEFFATTSTFAAPWEKGSILCYELGDPAGPLVLLVHGWQSNAGSMSAIGKKLALDGYHVVSFDLPAHGNSPLKYGNLHLFRLAFRAVLKRLNPAEPFSIVAHSFGSAITGFGLENTMYTCKNLVFLTTPNQMGEIFLEYKSMVGLGDRAYNHMLDQAANLLGERVESASVLQKLSGLQFEHLTFIHDTNDKILAYQNSVTMENDIANSTLVTFTNVGHYRMLWNAEVMHSVLQALRAKKVQLDLPEVELAVA